MKRRQFIKTAAGVTMCLPLLEGLMSSQELKAAADTPSPYMITFKNSCGRGQNFWQGNAGDLTKASMAGTTSEVYADYASKVLLVNGIAHNITTNKGCSHALSSAILLSGGGYSGGAGNGEGAGSERSTSQSLDYYAAQQLDSKDPFALWAATQENKKANLTWKGANQEYTPVFNPATAYKNLFGFDIGGSMPAAGASTDGTELLKSSINDLLKSQLSALSLDKRLSAADKMRLDQHLTAIRSVEKGIGALSTAVLSADSTAKIKNELGKNQSSYYQRQHEVARLHMDLISLAIASGSRHVATLTMGVCIDFNTYAGNSQSFHQVSHYNEYSGGDEASRQAKLTAHDRAFAEDFKYLLDQLSARAYGDKTLLDYGVTMWLCDMGPHDYYGHKQTDLQFVVAGGGASGNLQQGKKIDVKGVLNNRFLGSIGATIGLKGPSGSLMTDYNASEGEKAASDSGSNHNGQGFTGLIPEMFKKTPS
ncbi:MAG: DUF1552 domain-containing protein [Chitinophagaceae bacterium]|nr:DUF1552 domain-containing protein [Oligoflexus sp.]